MKRLVVYPYKMGSASSKLLAKALDAIRVFPDRDYSPKKNDLIVNWGSGHRPIWGAELVSRSQILNHWQNICFAIDKAESFSHFLAGGVCVPKFTQSRTKAISWLEEGIVVVGRQVLEGTRGEGVCVMEKPTQFRTCCLYTQYEEPTKEFRVYTFNGKFLDALEKRRDSDRLAEGTINYQVRTEENGWVFCHNGVYVPQEVAKQAVLATNALGLMFGGVDIIWNEKTKRASVLEVNTAPGIFGTTVSLYAEEILKYAEKAA